VTLSPHQVHSSSSSNNNNNSPSPPPNQLLLLQEKHPTLLRHPARNRKNRNERRHRPNRRRRSLRFFPRPRAKMNASSQVPSHDFFPSLSSSFTLLLVIVVFVLSDCYCMCRSNPFTLVLINCVYYIIALCPRFFVQEMTCFSLSRFSHTTPKLTAAAARRLDFAQSVDD